MRVRLFAGAAEAAGRREQQVDGSMTLGDLRQALAAANGVEFPAVLARCSLMVDGVRLPDDAVVPDTATVDVLPPFAGG
ncbi:Molybdopterin converting factor, small subunit [Gordonia malaquae]|uniref:Molybdopterin synthase small subunit MoaD n=1 Tax=Gordonia malaquae NBRC 108250 TaxID=1223542 RepID=M3UGW6_GORML|nr:MoaD/ThiS family protein [Gordonia malaquae]GAC78550.1 molybdopterin synthase small subunit MoaD [Gordonia malaquae NBRC 108250]SED44792.1 Molybdopterin converting factor, small subunit [Gordonia malaquae]